MSETVAEQRLIDLEVKISLQEVAIETLQQTVFEQHREIGKLQDALSRHIRRFEAAASGGLDIGPADEKPPHY